MRKKHKKKTIKPNPLFMIFIRPVIHFILKHRYNMRMNDQVGIESLTPPYILLGNHVNFWDPFFLGIYLRQNPQYVASDNIFRTKLFYLLMKLFGSIPTSKFMTDTSTVANILRIIKANGVIGIFPEGRRTWDGKPLRHVPTVSRLVHKLKLPVVGVVVKGGYLSKPRWGRGLRKGHVEMEYRMLFSSEELKTLTWDECRSLLEERLTHDDNEWNEREEIAFVGKRPAEYIERVLFVCPKCKSIASFSSHRDTAECRICAYGFRYNAYGKLEPLSGPLVFSSVPEWNDWQIDYFFSYLTNTAPDTPLFEEGPAILWKGYRAEPLKRLNTGRAYFSSSGITFHTTVGKEKFFPIDEIHGENVQDKEKMEFYHANNLYRLDFISLRASAYMWFQAVNLLHQKAKELPADGRSHAY
jgi:1-acyl-sn-glycerol-3-phosphate acyltransferase